MRHAISVATPATSADFATWHTDNLFDGQIPRRLIGRAVTGQET